MASAEDMLFFSWTSGYFSYLQVCFPLLFPKELPWSPNFIKLAERTFLSGPFQDFVLSYAAF